MSLKKMKKTFGNFLPIHPERLKAPPLPLHGRFTNPTKAQIAQLVEQLAFNQLVLGSSPSLRTFSITRLILKD
jgi:hypothetical protein